MGDKLEVGEAGRLITEVQEIPLFYILLMKQKATLIQIHPGMVLKFPNCYRH